MTTPVEGTDGPRETNRSRVPDALHSAANKVTKAATSSMRSAQSFNETYRTERFAFSDARNFNRENQSLGFAQKIIST